MASARADNKVVAEFYEGHFALEQTSELGRTIIKDCINQIKNIKLLKDAVFYDINYKNDTIDMLKGLGLVQHMNFYDGLGMLVEQAAESYNLWFNFYPTTEPVKKILYERL